MFNRIKPIREYFPNKEVALSLIEKGKEKYRKSTKYVLTEKLPNGKLLGKLYITPAMAAIMYAVGKEPKNYDLNTPSQSYGWKFDETRDIINALDGLSKGNDFYWNLYYGEPVKAKIILQRIKKIA